MSLISPGVAGRGARDGDPPRPCQPWGRRALVEPAAGPGGSNRQARPVSRAQARQHSAARAAAPCARSCRRGVAAAGFGKGDGRFQGTSHRQRPERFRSHSGPPLANAPGSVPAGPNGPVQIGSQAVMIEPEGEGRYSQVAKLLSIRKDIIDIMNLRSLHAYREFYSLYGCTV